MNWWGKLVGGTVGLLIGGPLGGLLGAAVGHGLDHGMKFLRSPLDGGSERVQQAFFAATFSVMGRLSKVDGRVSEPEIDLARVVMGHMQFDEEQRHAAMRLFNQGKRDDFPLQQVLSQFRRECRHHRSLLQVFLEIQVSAVVADGVVSRGERELLHRIGEQLGFSSFDIDYLLDISRAQQDFAGTGEYVPEHIAEPDLDSAYAVLGVSAAATDREVKGAYRRLISQHHPDKLVAKGLPEEMLKLATAKTQEIKNAWEQVRHARRL